MLATALAATPAYAEPRASEFTLDNGLRLIVVPDHRAPVATHMIWYKVGAADEPAGSSGIAHFLEHLMFKGTDKIPAAQFSKIIAKNGGQDNAFTTQDVTSYHQSVAKDRLPLVMEMEADRMTGLRLTETDVLTERDVILEERRSRVDNDPSSILNEQMLAALYLNHSYGIPVIGWEHEMAKLSRQDAFDFYHRYYAPNNAIVVVAGDVEPEEVLALAQSTYGKVPAMAGIERPKRRAEPPQVVERRVILEDARAGQATMERDYLVPSYTTAKPGEAEAIELLMKIFGGGASSRLYRTVLVEKGSAAHVGAYYSGSGLDSGRIALYAVASEDADLAKVEADIDAEIARILDSGVTAEEVERAKKSLIADYVYEADGQSNLARRYGWSLATGATIKEIEEWPDAVRRVTVEEINAAARAYLDKRRSVTGWLMPKKG
jgi:zinc protease